MEQIIQLAILCMTGAVLALLLKRTTPELGVCLSLLTVVLACGAILHSIGELIDFLGCLAQRAGLSDEMLVPVWKAAGISVVVRIGGGVCRDAGDSALAAAVESAGAVCTVLAALPLFRSVLDLFLELMP